MQIEVAAIILTKNEEVRIAECIDHLKPYVDYILMVDSLSTDRTVEIATEKKVDKIVIRAFSGSFSEEKNWAEESLPLGYEWILYCDADERFPEEFLESMKEIIARDIVDSFRFPRENENRKDYPDYQVRLLKRGRSIWKHKIHEIPYSASKNMPIDQVSCKTLHSYPIKHLKRREDLKRKWW